MMTTTTKRRKPATTSPDATTMIRRRRSAMLEAGLEHQAAADRIQSQYKIPTTRQAVTNVINGHFVSAGGRIESALVRLIRDTLTTKGEHASAARITADYLGWAGVITDSSA